MAWNTHSPMRPKECSLKTVEPLVADATNVGLGYKADARLPRLSIPSRLISDVREFRPSVGPLPNRSLNGDHHE